jgi:hypothetical protein
MDTPSGAGGVGQFAQRPVDEFQSAKVPEPGNEIACDGEWYLLRSRNLRSGELLQQKGYLWVQGHGTSFDSGVSAPRRGVETSAHREAPDIERQLNGMSRGSECSMTVTDKAKILSDASRRPNPALADEQPAEVHWSVTGSLPARTWPSPEA